MRKKNHKKQTTTRLFVWFGGTNVFFFFIRNEDFTNKREDLLESKLHSGKQLEDSQGSVHPQRFVAWDLQVFLKAIDF